MFRIIGVPIDSAGAPGGTELAPAALRDHGLISAVGGEDGGDLAARVRAHGRDPVTGVVGLGDVCSMTTLVREEVARSLVEDRIPFLVGGCCSLVPGALAGVRDVRGKVTLAHLDGHLDIYDEVSSPSGEAADMPVAVALGLGPVSWVEACGGQSLDSASVWLVGARDREQADADGMVMPETFDPPLRVTETDELLSKGPGQVGEEVATSLSSIAPLWVHLDLDVVDPSLFFANDAPVPGGIDWEQLTQLLRPLLSSPNLAGFALACYNPEKDREGSNAERIVRVVEEAVMGGVGG